MQESEFTSGKVEFVAEILNESDDTSFSITLVQQGDDASYLIKEDTTYLQPSEADPETSRQINQEMIRVGDTLYASSKGQEGKWLEAEESTFDYLGDNVFVVFRKGGSEKFDLAGAVDLLEKGEGFKQEEGPAGEEIYSAKVDFEANSFEDEEVMQLPAGLDLIVGEGGIADVTVTARNGVLEEIALSMCSSIQTSNLEQQHKR